MKRSICLTTFFIAVVSMTPLSSSGFAAPGNPGIAPSKAPGSHPWKDAFSVRHSIEMTQPWSMNSSNALAPQIASTSPDGKRTLILTMQGDLAKGKNHYTLWMYDTEELKRFAASNGKGKRPQGRAIYRLSTNDFAYVYEAAYPLPIRYLQWLDDGNEFAFILAEEGDAGDVYTFDIPTGKLRRLTNEEGAVISYAISKENNVVVYLANVATDCPTAFPEPEKVGKYAFPMHVGLCEYPGMTQRFPRQRAQLFKAPFHSHSEVQSVPNTRLPISEQFTYIPEFSATPTKLRLSPDGKWATLIASTLSQAPLHWKKYFPQIGATDMWVAFGGTTEQNNLVGEGLVMMPQFMLADIDRGVTKPMFDAPAAHAGLFSDSHWSPDSKRVILTHTHLPDDVFPAGQSRTAPEKAHFVEYDVEHKQIAPIYAFDEPMANRGLVDNPVLTTELIDGHRFAAKVSLKRTQSSRDLMPTTNFFYRVFEKTTSGWHYRDVEAKTLNGNQNNSIAIVVREDLNTPPDYYVEDRKSGRVVRLTDLNPQLREIILPKAQIIEWTADDGRKWKGALILPPDHNRSRQYPLVIQIHCLDENSFFRDASDPAETAPFAGRALASAGIAVLHIKPTPQGRDINIEFDSPQGRAVFFEGLQSAIRKLSTEYSVDPDRIGILGWSVGGRLVMEALTKTDIRFRAAVIADADTHGPMAYFLSPGWPIDKTRIIETALDASPWGEGKMKWVENNPVYLADRIGAALRIEMYERQFAIAWYDVFTMMKRLNKPVEYYVYDGASHSPLNPIQRYISSQGTVDWMRFWLMGEEDPDPKKQEQYITWRKMRDQAAQSAQGNPPTTATAH